MSEIILRTNNLIFVLSIGYISLGIYEYILYYFVFNINIESQFIIIKCILNILFGLSLLIIIFGKIN